MSCPLFLFFSCVMWLCSFATVYFLPVGAHHMTDFEEKYETVHTLNIGDKSGLGSPVV